MNRVLTLALVGLALPLAACGSVDAGNIGLFNRFGEISQSTAAPGMHGLNPLTTSLEQMSVRDEPLSGETSVYTKDIQQAGVKFNIVTRLNPANVYQMRTAIGLEWRDKLLPPLVEATIKDVFGRFNATEAVAERSKIQDAILQTLRARLKARGVLVSQFQLTNLDFSDAFESAVEAAQVATQKATEAKNATVRVKEEAEQTRIKAEAEANRIRVQAQAISANPEIVQLRWVEAWDGKMPSTVYCSSNTPCVQGK